MTEQEEVHERLGLTVPNLATGGVVDYGPEILTRFSEVSRAIIYEVFSRHRATYVLDREGTKDGLRGNYVVVLPAYGLPYRPAPYEELVLKQSDETLTFEWGSVGVEVQFGGDYSAPDSIDRVVETLDVLYLRKQRPGKNEPRLTKVPRYSP